MARFVRDEKNTFPFTWLIIGGAFAISTVWAVYAELVTRVPWQEYQDAFYQLELRLAQEAHAKADADFKKASEAEPLKSQLARAAELEAEMKSGDLGEAAKRLAELDLAFAAAENKKTFGASDLDEAYYYRNLAEYERDAAQVHVRETYKTVHGEADPERAKSEPNTIYADPPAPGSLENETKASLHLRTEIARMTAHVNALDETLKTNQPPELLEALKKSRATEEMVTQKLQVEQKHQARIDQALAEMAGIDGPPEPRMPAESDPKKAAEARDAARAAACVGHEDTRNCIKWLRIGPKETELKLLTIAIAKAKRPLEDAELRLGNAKAKAEPTFDIKNPIASLVGPFQIEQVVFSWMHAERDVDLQQVDRCHTCHMGTNSALYTGTDIPRAFRSHPARDLLGKSHPIEKFGCTVCHQGQGRATDDLAHSGWHLEVHHGHERWHYAGDHYWEDPLLPVGKLTKVVVDGRNDTLEVKIGKGKRVPITLDHRSTALTVDQDESPEDALIAELQTKLQAVVDGDEKVKAGWRAVARKLDNRVSLGLESFAEGAEKEVPSIEIAFTKIEVAEMLGFGYTRALTSKTQPLFKAHGPPVPPIRADSAEAQGTTVDTPEEYKFIPPNGAFGLTVPDNMRNRMIRGLPEIEAGCLRCHNADADLMPWRSHAKHVDEKLAHMRAEAERTADPVAYRAAHGTDDLPPVSASPAEILEEHGSLAPTLDYGRWLFRQLNCTGCHLLRGYTNNKDAGPQLDDVSAKVRPEWLLTWLRHPRGWRPKTSMPNMWPLPLDPASKLPYAAGSPEHEQWQKARAEETVAVAAFLWDRSENPATRPAAATVTPTAAKGDAVGTKPLRQKIDGLSKVEGASAELGKEIFEAYGCQGCHAVTEGKELPDAWRARERDIAPTLTNLKDKIQSADWVAYWVRNPANYWHGTAMPNLRLTDVEAASVGLYLVTLGEKPPFPAEVAADEVKLVTEASLRAQEIDCAAAGGIKLSRVACGQKIIEKRGCFGCHRISGFEMLAPIGPELTGFAQKDITTLDYGYAIADHHLQTTETFAALKLDSPRIYERDRIELYMGDFDVSADEIRALVLFLKGAINGRPNETYDPMQQELHASVVRGRQLVNDLNCRGCHLIEARGAEIDGFRQADLSQDPQRRAPFLDGEGARVQPEWLFTFLRDPQANGIRPWLHPEWAYGADVPKKQRALRMPTFNLTAEQWTDIVRYFASWDQEPYPFQVPKVRELAKDEKLWAVSNMNSTQTGNCLSCHFYREFPIERAKGDLKKMAPDMDLIRRRLRPSWVKMWLLRPQSFLPYTAMTAFFATKTRDKTAPMFPGQEDPFLSPKPKGWQEILPGFRQINNEEHVELLRDFLFQIPEGAPWPAIGTEAQSVMVDPEAAAKLAADAAAAADNPEGEPPPEPQPGG